MINERGCSSLLIYDVWEGLLFLMKQRPCPPPLPPVHHDLPPPISLSPSLPSSLLVQLARGSWNGRRKGEFQFAIASPTSFLLSVMHSPSGNLPTSFLHWPFLFTCPPFPPPGNSPTMHSPSLLGDGAGLSTGEGRAREGGGVIGKGRGEGGGGGVE